MAEPWDLGQYDKLSDYHRRPFAELMSRVDVASRQIVLDLGCGSGGHAVEMAARWPQARAVGVDSSPEMLDQARRDDTGGRVELGLRRR